MKDRPGFTLIELLIVVAIIGILAAVAVPNFLNAQMKARVVRAYADMRNIETALETYRLESNNYPPSLYTTSPRPLVRLTSPVAYLSSVPADEFKKHLTGQNLDAVYGHDYNYWAAYESERYRRGGYQDEGWDWFLFSPGPNLTIEWCYYHPSNGVVSNCDIYKFNDRHEGKSF
ncbi:MAG TPA: prepilin-type N-terminal cleavage/methylation domain-containing protein [bacterium]|nr:prepilin-type N-terminal cleavage/methylation domain-containing protein [bacterium]HQO35263.1 prepilin-type N-terminal cleavage/methylation domain-containing protein [bacterium]HQQ00813.1 prepilin-type N-terminal cleavage/methylation domain-containing protein [bacterium]